MISPGKPESLRDFGLYEKMEVSEVNAREPAMLAKVEYGVVTRSDAQASFYFLTGKSMWQCNNIQNFRSLERQFRDELLYTNSCTNQS